MSAEYSYDVSGAAPYLRAVGKAKTRPVNEADVAQARVFEEILQREIAGLEQLVASVAARRDQRNACATLQPSDELARLRGRLAEAQRLLTALRHRFR